MYFLESILSGTVSVLAAFAIIALSFWVMNNVKYERHPISNLAAATTMPVAKPRVPVTKPSVAWSPDPNDTKCTITGNHWFDHKCPKGGGPCSLQLSIQYYIENHHLWPQLFTLYCEIVHGPGKRWKHKSTIHRTILGYGSNELGGVFFKWDKVARGKVKRKYHYNCACTNIPTEGTRTVSTTFKEIFK